MRLDKWFLTADERGNAATRLDTRHADGAAWSAGNEVRALVHGAEYFAELAASVAALRPGDLLFFTDWRGDPDERLTDGGPTVRDAFSAAARRGVVVKGLIWRSHLDAFQFSAEENRHLGDAIEAAGGECLLDMRVRTGGSHHQKFVILRHRDNPERDVAYLGGIDLCHSRRDDATHRGDPQPQRMASVYGDRPPWHDVQLALRGPVVGDVETVFRERWEDPTRLTRHPVHRLRDALSHEDTSPDPLPPQPPDPEPAGGHAIQLLRTYPYRHRKGYPFAPRGERSIARGYVKALRRARRLIYLEDQYLWSEDVAMVFAHALAARPSLRVIAVVPPYPDQDGLAAPPQNLGRERALALLHRAGRDRVAVYGLENKAGGPVYVHAKVCVVDDVWAVVGSDNLNRRSWTFDSELSCAVLDDERDPREPTDPAGLGDGARAFARELRLRLSREHLDREPGDDADLVDPDAAFAAFRRSAAALDAWHQHRDGPRPPGRLRPYRAPRLSRVARFWSAPLYHVGLDPDGRPPELRGRGKI